MSFALESPAVVDLSTIPGPQRHAAIFTVFEGLAIGQQTELHSDHEPAPLKRQFMERFAGQLSWEVLEQGPLRWRVRIERLKAAGASCCGCCGGGSAAR